MSDSGPGSKDSVTEVAEESFVRERPPDIERGTVLAGRYQIEDIIGKGGSGIVLRVFDRTAQNVVALKVLKSELARDARWEKRFSRELRLGRPIQHPNVCRIFDIGEADGHRFLTMEIARGGSLRDELKRGGGLERPLEEKMADARAVIGGLAALHAAGVVHRDFKPDNLLRMEDGRLVLSDFGLATDAATAPGATVLIGTPHYMAPEVLAGEPATSRSDVWALAVVLHEIFFGRRPERRSVSFDGSSKGPIRPNSSTERRVMALCEKCLAESPMDRPADAREVALLFDSQRRSLPNGSTLRNKTVLAVSGLVAAVVLTVAVRAVKRHRRETSAAATFRTATAMTTTAIRLEAEGDPVDWSRSARVIREIPGRVHCFSVINDETVRIVWGSPRRAEDVDVESGAHRVARLAPETFRVGCPELSPNRKALLFTAQTQAGASEIRVSTPDGREAKSVTSGADPLWLGGNDEFLYSVDSSHAAVFSLPAMSFTLLTDPKFGQGRASILNKAVSQSGNTVALVLGADNTEFGIAVYDQPPFEHAKVFAVPHPFQIQFEPGNDAILFEYDTPQSSPELVELDWRHERLRSIAKYPGFDLMWSAFPVGQAAAKLLVVRHFSSDVWLYNGKKKRKLTEDGADYSADLSPSGELLVSRLGAGGAFSIWQRSPDGSERRLTSGPRDITPAFSRDGRFWTYSDYATKSVMLCSSMTGECHVLHKDEVFPQSPQLSPDGTSLAFVSGMGSPKITIISATDGRVRTSWDGQYQCAPVWTATTIWSLEAGAGRYYWSEHNAVSGERTGKRIEVLAENMDVTEVQCGSTLPNSPIFQPLRIEKEEISKILVAR